MNCNKSILSNLIHNGFAPVKVLYEISYGFSSNKILPKSKSSSAVSLRFNISSSHFNTNFPITCFSSEQFLIFKYQRYMLYCIHNCMC